MSNFIHGKIYTNDLSQIENSEFNFTIIEFCVKNKFGLHFADILQTKFESLINFQISDNFLVNYCESFMEPIIYTLDGIPLINNICEQLDTLEGLVHKIFEFKFVTKIELRFSYIEVNEDEYEICETSVKEMKNTILERFLCDTGFPVVNFIVEK